MTQTHERPQGYQQANVEIAGYWLPKEGPIHGRLIGGFRFRNSKRRMTLVYLIRVKDECIASVKLEGGGLGPFTVSPGEVVAVFHSGGLFRLQNLYGCMVWIQAQLDDKGEFKTKALEQGDMKLYELLYSGNKKKLPIETRIEQDMPEDDESNDYPDTDTDDDIPF